MVFVRAFGIEDLDAIHHLQPEGWSDIVPFFRFYLAQEFCHPLAACDGERLVGVANAIVNKKSGWLAHIIVAADSRRMGIGYQLTERLMDILAKEGCASQLLIATQMGEGLYRKFGFRTVGEYLFFNEGRIRADGEVYGIRPYRDADLDRIAALDLDISGEHRMHMLTRFLHDAYIFEADQRIRGFFLSGFEEGMIMASDDEAGKALLRFKHSRAQRKTVIPSANTAGVDFLLSQQFRIVNRAPRMSCGQRIVWKPEFIWSRAGGFYG